jgi:hypothetical protein
MVRTKYRPHRWSWGDSLVVLGLLVSLLPILPFPNFDRAVFAYLPYPQISAPPFALTIGLAFLGLSLPAILAILPGKLMEIRR